MNRLTDDPRWLPAMSERVTEWVQRDRNHPSVIIWSLGMSQATALITTHSIAGSNLSIHPARCSMKAAEPTPRPPILFARCTRAWMKTPFPAVPKWSIKKWLSLPGETRPLILANTPTRWVTVLAASLNTGRRFVSTPFTGRLRLGLGGSVAD
ncbi:beta-D-galactosidase [Escherichia coli]|nr:beta-D-galactosidase [Escherichia coli]